MGPFRGMGPFHGGMDSKGNSKDVLEPLAEDPRYYEVYTGDPGKDGFVCVGRRPRVRGFDEMMDKEQADRIEGIFNPDAEYDY